MGVFDRARSSTPASSARRWTLVALVLLGIGLVAAPFAFGMFEKAPKGAEMMDEFKPFMTDARLSGFQRHLKNIDDGVSQTHGRARVVLEGHGSAAHARFDKRFPSFAQFDSDWPPIYADMTGLMDKIQANVGNYEAMVALPSFELFPWFFVIPGALVALLALVALAAPRLRGSIRWALVAVGIGLVVAPVVFQMFDRGPKGAEMMKSFETIETRPKVEQMQGYFGTIAGGQGALRLEIVPALRRSGLSQRQVAAQFPDVVTLNRRWIGILNDMTPMIGAMSDNVDNYQALTSLPSFKLFAWFFLAPGLLIAGLALASRRRT
jgi:hypothetical protein